MNFETSLTFIPKKSLIFPIIKPYREKLHCQTLPNKRF